MIYNSIEPFHTTNTNRAMNKLNELSDFSSQSVLRAMDKFLKSVNTMNETIMLPCRLLDIEVHGREERVPALLQGSTDPYAYYTLLNNVKNDLLWGSTVSDVENNGKKTTNKEECGDRWSGSPSSSSSSSSIINSSSNTYSSSNGNNTSNNNNNNNNNTQQTKGHIRRQSTLSMISVNSTNSDGERSENCENSSSEADDSGVDVEDASNSDPSASSSSSSAVITNLNTHLVGLHTCLSNLTEVATYITDRYQQDINM